MSRIIEKGEDRMISIKKFRRRLEEILGEMEQSNARKITSITLHKTRRNDYRVSKNFLKGLLKTIEEMQKTKVSMTILDLPNDDSRSIFRDITEGIFIMDSRSKELMIGVRL